MKKFFAIALSAALLLIGTQANAQLSIGAGYLNSNESTTIGSSDPSTTNYNGAYAGFNYNIPIVAGLGIAPGFYASWLTKTNADGGSLGPIKVSGKSAYNEIALNVPVNVNYSIDLARDTKVFLYAGPIFQYGVMSQTSAEGGVSWGDLKFDTGTKSINNYDADNGSRNPFNIYIGGGAGINVAGIQVIVGYDHSLMNGAKSEDVKIGRSQIKVGVGYSF